MNFLAIAVMIAVRLAAPAAVVAVVVVALFIHECLKGIRRERDAGLQVISLEIPDGCFDVVVDIVVQLLLRREEVAQMRKGVDERREHDGDDEKKGPIMYLNVYRSE